MRKIILTLALIFPVLIMAQTTNQVTEDFLQSFADAFNAHDINASMAYDRRLRI
jgi:hypothetical protein